MLKKTCLIIAATLMTVASVPGFAAAKSTPAQSSITCGLWVPWCPKY